MLTTLLIGLALGGCWVLGVVFAICEVKTKEKRRKEDDKVAAAVRSRVYTLQAENARSCGLSLAAGEMTEEGKKVATMTMAALDAVIAAAKKAA